jgi:hypothetical protein
MIFSQGALGAYLRFSSFVYVQRGWKKGHLEKMGAQRIHARTNSGFPLKVLASLSALTFTNAL